MRRKGGKREAWSRIVQAVTGSVVMYAGNHVMNQSGNVQHYGKEYGEPLSPSSRAMPCRFVHVVQA